MKKNTLRNKVGMAALRELMIAAMTVAMALVGKNNKLYYPVMWLRHYLIGSGRPLKVPGKIVSQAKTALFTALWQDSWGTMEYTRQPYGKYCVCSSTMYEGHGFGNRPTLFYLLGGFSFMFDEHKEYPIDSIKSAVIKGTDTYDWHCNEDGRYFYSPLGKEKRIVDIVRLMSRLYGEDLFCIGQDGNACISNKLWEEMHDYGARAFVSSFHTVLKFNKEEQYEISNALSYYGIYD